jgi:hypothetical protein
VASFWSVGVFKERGRLLTDVPAGFDIDEIEWVVWPASGAADPPSAVHVMRGVYAKGLAFCGRAITAVRGTDRPTIGAHVFRCDVATGYLAPSQKHARRF